MRIAMVAALVAIASCGDGAGGEDGNPAGGTYSCRAAFPGADGGVGAPAVCLEVSGGTAQDVTNNRQQCVAQGNMFAQEPCPRAGALGGCRQTVAATGLVITDWYYANGGLTTASVQMLCDGLASVAPSIITVDFVPP
jgi:hypothetical protein